MKPQATRIDVIERQEIARKRRIEALLCIPAGAVIAGVYAYLFAGLFGAA